METKTQGKNELKDKFVELRASGFSFATIAEKLGVSKPTLISWSKELSLQIKNERSLRIDELCQRFVIAKEKRVEAFGRRLDAIMAELDRRDLSDVRTEALFSLMLKYGEILRAEYEPLTLSEKKAIMEDLNDYGTSKWEA